MHSPQIYVSPPLFICANSIKTEVHSSDMASSHPGSGGVDVSISLSAVLGGDRIRSDNSPVHVGTISLYRVGDIHESSIIRSSLEKSGSCYRVWSGGDAVRS